MTEEAIQLIPLKSQENELSDIRQEANPTESALQGNGESPKISLRQRLIFIGILAIDVTMFMSFAILAPVFPIEAKKKGLSDTEIGYTFGIFALTCSLANPVCGKFMPVLGSKFMFVSGAFVATGSVIIFGVLNMINGRTTFLVYCLIVRSFQGIGTAAEATSSIALIAKIYPDSVAHKVGLVELATGLGGAIGSPLASLFYSIGGYNLPFSVLGGATMLFVLLNYFIIPTQESPNREENKSGSFIEVLRIPGTWLLLVGPFIANCSLGFLGPTLGLHVISPPINAAEYLVGVVFLFQGGVYTLSAPLIGYITDRLETPYGLVTAAFFIDGIGYMLLGPSPILYFEGRLWVEFIALTLIGLSLGMQVVTAFAGILKVAIRNGLPDNTSTHGIISGMTSSACALGSFTGPIVGSILVDCIGFKWASTAFGLPCFVAGILSCLFLGWEYQWGRGRRKPRHLDMLEEDSCIIVS